MKTTLTKLLCLLLVLTMAFVVVGCKDKSGDPATTTGGNDGGIDPGDGKNPFPYEIMNWGGKQLTIASIEGSADSFFTMTCGLELAGYEVHDAIFKRDQNAYETFGIDVYYQTYPSGDDGKTLRDTLTPLLKENRYICDMINSNLKNCILNLSALGYLSDMNSLQYINTDHDWWASYFAEGASFHDKLYYAAGMNVGGGYFATPYAMFCNTNLQRDVSLEDGTPMDIFTLVDEGNWTLDVMIDIITDYSKNLDGVGEFNTDEDLMAYAHIKGGVTSSAHFIAAGGKFSTITEDGDLDVYNIITAQSTQQIAKQVQEMFDIVKDNYNENFFDGQQEAAFTGDRALFFGNSMSYVNSFINMESDYAIIPCPKSTSGVTSEYFSAINEWTPGYTAISDNPIDPAFVSYAAEALGWLSYNTVKPEVYDATLCLRVVREDERQITIMDTIYANLYIDLNFINDFGLSKTKIGNVLMTTNNYFTAVSKLDRYIDIDVQDFIGKLERDS